MKGGGGGGGAVPTCQVSCQKGFPLVNSLYMTFCLQVLLDRVERVQQLCNKKDKFLQVKFVCVCVGGGGGGEQPFSS